MIRLLFYSVIILMLGSCQALDHLPFTLESNSPIFRAEIKAGNKNKILEAGIDSYYMFTEKDTLNHMIISKANLASSFRNQPRVEESLVYSYIGANLALDEYLPLDGMAELFNKSWQTSWGLRISPSPFGIASSIGSYVMFVNGERVPFSQDSFLIIKETVDNSIMLEKTIQGRRYFSKLSHLENFDFLSEHNSVVNLEAKGSDSVFLEIVTNIDQPQISIVTPSLEELEYEEGMQLNLYGEYRVRIQSLTGQGQFEMNFWAEYTDGVNLQFIGFSAETQKLGVLHALGSSIVEYFDEEGNCFSTLFSNNEDFQASYFTIHSFKDFEIETESVRLIQIEFECNLILRDSQGEKLSLSGSGTLAIPMI